MSLKLSQSFSFFGGGDSFSLDDEKVGTSKTHERSPTLKLQTDKEIYRPGDSFIATIEIFSPEISKWIHETERRLGEVSAFLVENLTFEIKGIEKLDTQWFATQKPLPGSKEKRGEHLFLDCTTPSLISKVIISSGSSKTYLVRAELPKILPPSYRGTTIRYIYYVKSTLCGRWLVLDDKRDSKNDLIQLEARSPLQIWVMQKSSGLLTEEGQNDGSSPGAAVMDIYWKEKNADSEWARANETLDEFEEGYDSSRDEISSVSSYNPSKQNLDVAFKSSLSLQSMAPKPYNSEVQHSQGEPSSFRSYMTLSQLSVAEVIDDTSMGLVSSQKKPSSYTSTVLSPSWRKFSNSPFSKDDTGALSALGSVEPVASEGFIRGRSYNIRIDDQVLLRFSPKNSDSTYYFGDMIGGTLTIFHGGARRCLEVSITLETSETITQHFVHPSRRSSPTITKVQSDHHEVVADLMQTSFLFSIPMDGPMSFSTSYISVQWALRFEFFTTPKSVDWTRYEHPLLIEEREKGDWILPITVYAPPPRTQAGHTKNEKSSSLGNLWVRT